MSCCKCIKFECIQVLNGPASIKCDTESILRVHISHASIENDFSVSSNNGSTLSLILTKFAADDKPIEHSRM